MLIHALRIRGHARFRTALRGVVFSVLGATVLPPSAARADSASADVDAIVKNGTELRRQGRDREALAEFQRAAAIRESPRVRAQIGLAEQALGSWVDANTHLGHALEHRDDPWIEKNRVTLEAAQATIRSHLGQVEVWGTPTDGRVELDGVLVGKLPSVVVWAPVGDASLTVSAPGYATITRPLNVAPTARAREHVDLRPLPPMAKLPQVEPLVATRTDAPPLVAEPGPADLGADARGARTDTRAPAESASTPLFQRWWLWTAIGVVAVGAGAGVYFLTRGHGTTVCMMPPCDQL